MNKETQDDFITDLLIDFDEMGFIPTTLVPNPEEYAIEWRRKITQEIDKIKEENEKLKADNHLFYQEQIKDRKQIETIKRLNGQLTESSYVNGIRIKAIQDLLSIAKEESFYMGASLAVPLEVLERRAKEILSNS